MKKVENPTIRKILICYSERTQNYLSNAGSSSKQISNKRYSVNHR